MLKVVMIGAGNVASCMAQGLRDRCELVQIYNRHKEGAMRLAELIGCDSVTDDFSQLRTDADVYVVSVKDDAVGAVVEAVADNGALWVHTSGSVPMSVFAGKRKRYGVFYPMQSFTKGHSVDWSQVPLFVEGCDSDALESITSFAHSLSSKVYEADSEKRKRLHIAAVFACNFANYMWIKSADVLAEAQLPFDVMLPLIRSTVDKLGEMTPMESQTGPAIRGDVGVTSSHIAMLDGMDAEGAKLYATLSDSIMRRFKTGPYNDTKE